MLLFSQYFSFNGGELMARSKSKQRRIKLLYRRKRHLREKRVRDRIRKGRPAAERKSAPKKEKVQKAPKSEAAG
jgi:hypothetical protein